ncbi:hypothetical protein EV129_12739 [Rhizobium azibense]|uniref:Uncharacterized protein n=1 Tax=Rhizobium azibense TaxID=1136135 RepID=A0A4R3RAP4_9HYPH|nr:hypothetical protein EV129_12739 [Rhizobium azibense]
MLAVQAKTVDTHATMHRRSKSIDYRCGLQTRESETVFVVHLSNTGCPTTCQGLPRTIIYIELILLPGS